MQDVEIKIQELETRISSIEQRNYSVELDKAWEKSLTRTLLVLVLTYALTACVFYILGLDNYLLNALIPSLAYYLSTLSLTLFKRVWIEKRAK